MVTWSQSVLMPLSEAVIFLVARFLWRRRRIGTTSVWTITTAVARSRDS
ncbi:MAG: hypothetical protein QOE71_1401 [Pseudonocardiales bacterium]|jgi:hypothetical protein|nr:hypothetical protein [Pseudonocardiales bacterium]